MEQHSDIETEGLPYQIRKPNEVDLVALCQLAQQLGFPITVEDMRYRLKLYAQHPLNRSWVAVGNDNQVIGCIAMHVAELFHQAGYSARVVSLIVDSGYRRLGIASSLLDMAETYSQQLGCETLELAASIQSQWANAFFLRRGYTSNHTQETFFKPLHGTVLSS